MKRTVKTTKTSRSAREVATPKTTRRARPTKVVSNQSDDNLSRLEKCLQELGATLRALDGHEYNVGRNRAVAVINDVTRRHQAREVTKFYVGQHVEFTHSKTGQVISGRVTRINQRTVSLAADGTFPFMTWKVSPSLLRPSSAKSASSKSDESELAKSAARLSRGLNRKRRGGHVLGMF